MIGIIYRTESNEVIGRIEGVQTFTDTSLVGKEATVCGINREEAEFVIVEANDLQPGDIIDLSIVTDVRHLVPETPEQKINQLQENLDMAVLEITTAMAAQQGV